MGDLHLILPALNLSTLNASILIMMQQVRLIMFSLKMVDYSMDKWGDHSELFFSLSFCGTTPACLKVIGWVGSGP